MRFSALISVALLFANGCTTNHPSVSASQITQKQQELTTLCSEIDVLTRHLQRLQDKEVTNSTYSAIVQAHDLDRSILAARQARDILMTADRKLMDELTVYESRH
jgi:uncharacterized protein YigA (DUF484 family)